MVAGSVSPQAFPHGDYLSELSSTFWPAYPVCPTARNKTSSSALRASDPGHQHSHTSVMSVGDPLSFEYTSAQGKLAEIETLYKFKE